MHILNPTVESTQDVTIAPRLTSGSYVYALVQEEESGNSYEYVVAPSTTNSYRTMRLLFPYAKEGNFLYIRVFKPTEPLTDAMAAISEQETPVAITRRVSLDRLDTYFSNADLVSEIYRGKMFCTATENLEKYSMYGQDPFTTTDEDNTAQWKTY